MAGLLGDVLPYVYSRGNALRRGLSGLLADPVGSTEQTLGLLNDKRVEQENVMARAFANPKNPLQVTDQGALDQATANVLAGALGFAPMGIMAGVGAKTANKAALAKAEAMERQGAKPAQIWQETGWGKGPDGRWRFEIDDSKAGMRLNTQKYGTQDYTPWGETLSHPAAFKAYPDAKKINTTWHDSGGMYYVKNGPEEYINLSRPHGDPKKNTSYSLHEFQHAIQEREGFSAGGSPTQADIQAFAKQIFDQNKAQFSGNPDDLMKMSQEFAYKRLAGEAEARLVQSRMAMTPEQRLSAYPWEPTYFQEATGVPLNSLIHR